MPKAPRRIVLRSFAKINLGLQVIGKRPDGYHEVRTVLQTIDLHDQLVLERTRMPGIHFGSNALEIDPVDNLVTRAIRIFLRRAKVSGGVRARLEKVIPIAAGLGGGSSNAAATLLGLARLFRLDLGPSDLLPWAVKLGSDVPFFLLGGTALGVGRGSEVYPLPEPPERHVLLAIPSRGTSTEKAYSSLSLQLTKAHPESMIPRFCSGFWTGLEHQRSQDNDFETIFFESFPRLRRVKAEFLAAGALAAGLTGSGSALFGLFGRSGELKRAIAGMARLDLQLVRTRTLKRAAYRSALVECLR